MINLPLQQIPGLSEAELAQKADSLHQASQEFVNVLKENPQQALDQLLHGAMDFGLKVLAALLVYIIGIWLIKRIKKALKRNFERKNTDKTIASFTTSLVSVILTVLVITICIGTLGINTTSLAALLAAGGMAIGMALSGALQNFAGGIMLLIFKPFKVGDFIEAQGYSGTVNEVNMVSTRLTTTDNRVIIIPNGALSSGNINNYSLLPSRRVDFLLPLAHSTSSDAFINEVNSVISKDERVFNSFVAINKVDTSMVEFVVKLWVKTEDYWDVYHSFYKAIYDDAQAKGFRFATSRITIEKES